MSRTQGRAPSQWKSIAVPAQLLMMAPNLKGYQRQVRDGHLSVFVGVEPEGWHLSISHRTNDRPPRPGRYPTWDEIKEARYRFCPSRVTMAMFLPPTDEYVNVHDTTFHLWESR